jgi:hypothetical protein
MPRPNSQLNLELFPETLAPSDLTKATTDANKVKSLCLVCEPEVPIYAETTPIFVGLAG